MVGDRSVNLFRIMQKIGVEFNSGLHACKAGALPLEPYLQSSVLGVFEIGSCFLSGSNLDLNSAS
jgi:hypothetical protein